ncbi:MAG: NeuD/PglB/VioB family sugar acetyltransferase [Flavobacterium sp.]|jgi:sugar O-acyltransferase (sialic acid O-acetyltransferase NeuD family)|nr:NeuD/PglB/VioB family sugar acetyltransferase [Flavobacterium sp.]
MKKVIIVGAGSVGKFLAYNSNQFTDTFEFIGFLDDDIKKHNKIIAGIPVLGSIDMLPNYIHENIAVAWGIAFPKIKAQIVAKFADVKADYPIFISKKAWISNEVTIGPGAIIYPGCSINYETKIGAFVVMNMNCAIGHNVTISDFCSLAPGVNLGGHTKIEERTEMGIGSATKQNIKISHDCIIGGQAMVVKNVSCFDTIKGVPAR